VANVGGSAFHSENGGNGANGLTVNQILTANNGTYGSIFLLSVDNPIISQALLAHSSDNGIHMTLDNGKLTNNILMGNTTGCATSGGVNPGITNVCGLQGASDANFVNNGTTYNLTNSFVGKVTSDSNPSHTSGTSVYNAITDSVTFDNFFRGWSIAGTTFPNTNQRSYCTSTDTCQIWDWRLKATDTVVRNKSLDGASANAAFVAGATCPAAVHGNKALMDQQTIVHTFLINAVEIVDDGIGNDNGLC
jgi:hypothetical protein